MDESATSQGGLLGARFAPPRAPTTAVERARLIGKIERADVKLTLICAPAGYGKTTLMQQLRKRYQGRGFVTLWLRVNSSDNSLGAFVQSLAIAMRATLPEGAVRPVLSNFEAVGSPQGLAAELIERLSMAKAEIALFLDDLEILVSEAVRLFLQRFVEEFDARHRLIMGCRRAPGLALARMRAQGETIELSQDDLRFTSEETYAYLERQGISASSAHSLQQRTEGWPAALQLAAVALKARASATSTNCAPRCAPTPRSLSILPKRSWKAGPGGNATFSCDPPFSANSHRKCAMRRLNAPIARK